MWSLFSLFRRHWVGVIFALFSGLIVVGPNLFFVNSTSYKGLPMVYSDAESLYLSRINAVYKGCIVSCNPYIKEYGNKYPFFDPSISETILAIPGVILNISVPALKVFYEFFLPFVLSLLIYSLIFRLTSSVAWSVFGSVFIVLGYNLINDVDLISFIDFGNIFKWKTNETSFLQFSRPVNPQFSSLIFFVYLHVLLSTMMKKTWKWFITLALVYGFSFYIYFFTYTFITLVQGVLIGLFLLHKEYSSIFKSIVSTILGLIIGVPVIIEIYKVFHHPYYSTIPTEYLIKTHTPDFTLIGIILFGLFIVIFALSLLKIKKNKVSTYFVTILVLSCFIMRNQHIITGAIMQYSHYEWYFFSPIFVVAIVYFSWIFLSNSHNTRYQYILYLLILLGIANGILVQYSSYVHWLPYAEKSQRYVPVLNWIKNNISPDTIISAPYELSSIIPFYTKNYVMWSFFAGQYIRIPDRLDDFANSRLSAEKLMSIGTKYNVDYFIESKQSNLLKKYDTKMIFEDGNFVVYAL
ncbi:MAG: hypothetical protein NUV47_00845 [Patescibacteria group bacterium]|nr:hypothetical protein [Patescibacteria group bacterium]